MTIGWWQLVGDDWWVATQITAAQRRRPRPVVGRTSDYLESKVSNHSGAAAETQQPSQRQPAPERTSDPLENTKLLRLPRKSQRRRPSSPSQGQPAPGRTSDPPENGGDPSQRQPAPWRTSDPLVGELVCGNWWMAIGW